MAASVVKFKKGELLNSNCKQLVLNVFNYVNNNNNDKSISQIVREVSAMTGVCERTIFRYRDEGKNGPLETPVRKKRTGVANSREKKYDEGTRSRIRQVVHGFFMDNIPPTLDVVLEKVNKTEHLPTFSKSTLRRLLHDMGFVYGKQGRNSILIEKEEIVAWRRQYLREIRKLRNQGANIIYMDESWVNTGTTNGQVWQDTTIKNPRQAFVNGLTTGLKTPTGKGPRFVLVHAGNKDGFVEGADMTFLAKKGAEDYHEEMDGDLFEKWFENNLLPNLPKNKKNVIVMDNASYHSRKLSFPKKYWVKRQIQDWLYEKDIYFEEDYLKNELLATANAYKNIYDKYKIECIAEKYRNHSDKQYRVDVHILRLAPYHCELNPIELVWSEVKRYVSSKNSSFKTNDVKKLISEGYEKVRSTGHWESYVNHVINIENNFWKIDNMQDDIEPIIISLEDDSGDEGDYENEEFTI